MGEETSEPMQLVVALILVAGLAYILSTAIITNTGNTKKIVNNATPSITHLYDQYVLKNGIYINIKIIKVETPYALSLKKYVSRKYIPGNRLKPALEESEIDFNTPSQVYFVLPDGTKKQLKCMVNDLGKDTSSVFCYLSTELYGVDVDIFGNYFAQNGEIDGGTTITIKSD